MNHDELQEMLGAYALDAVEAEEAELIERHLADCPRCRAEVAEHREVAGLLGYAGSDAPAGLWDRIVSSLEEAPPAMRLAPVPEPGPARTGASDGGGQGPTVVPFRPKGRTIGMRAFAALATVAALVAIVLGVEVAHLNSTTNQLKAGIGVAAIEAGYKNALSNPGARRVMLKSGDGARTTAAVLLPDGTGYLDPRTLPTLPPNQTYQLWGVVGVDRVSLGLLGNAPRLIQFGAPDTVTALAVTAERAGGVVVSQNQPVVVGTVPSSPQPPSSNAISG